LNDLGTGTGHGKVPDPAKLMNADAPSDVTVIAEDHMPPQGGVAAHDQAAADNAVMGDMGIGKDHIIIPKHGKGSIVSGQVHCGIFAKDVPVADFQTWLPALVFEVVSFSTDESVGKNLVVLPHYRAPLHRGMMGNLRSFAEGDLCANKGVGTYADAFVQLCAFFNNSFRVNFGQIIHTKVVPGLQRSVKIVAECAGR